MWGIVGVQKEAVLAAQALDRDGRGNRRRSRPRARTRWSCPHGSVSAVCEVPGGAFPSYAQGYYPRDNAFYKTVGRDRARARGFIAWIEGHVLATADFAEFRRSFDAARGSVE